VGLDRGRRRGGGPGAGRLRARLALRDLEAQDETVVRIGPDDSAGLLDERARKIPRTALAQL
jgi:hypothetical protein